MNKKPNQNEKVEEPKVEEPKFADTIKMAIDMGLVAIDPTLEADVAELEMPEEITSCADHISRTKILNIIESTMARYNGKVVLAMYEVKNIIDTIIKAVKE